MKQCFLEKRMFILWVPTLPLKTTILFVIKGPNVNVTQYSHECRYYKKGKERLGANYIIKGARERNARECVHNR